jgi:hypothetical protein
MMVWSAIISTIIKQVEFKNKTTMEENNNPLEVLLRDEVETSAAADKLLAEILRPYVVVGRDDGTVHLNDNADALSAIQKTLLVFLGHLAGHHVLPNKVKHPSLSQAEVIRFLLPHGTPEGTVKTNLKALRDKKFIKENDSLTGRYEIPLSKLLAIKTYYFNGSTKD